MFGRNAGILPLLLTALLLSLVLLHGPSRTEACPAPAEAAAHGPSDRAFASAEEESAASSGDRAAVREDTKALLRLLAELEACELSTAGSSRKLAVSGMAIWDWAARQGDGLAEWDRMLFRFVSKLPEGELRALAEKLALLQALCALPEDVLNALLEEAGLSRSAPGDRDDFEAFLERLQRLLSDNIQKNADNVNISRRTHCRKKENLLSYPK